MALPNRKKKTNPLLNDFDAVIELGGAGGGAFYESKVAKKILKKHLVRIFAYVRVSTDEQAKTFSLDGQKATINDFVKKHGMELVNPIYTESHSAQTLARPVLRQMVNDIESLNEPIDAILVITADRLSRVSDQGALITRFMATKGIEIITCDSFNPHADDFLIKHIGFGVAQHYNMVRGRSVAAGVRQKREKGYWHGKPPYGYTSQDENGSYKVVVPDSVQAPVVKRMFQLALKGTTFREMKEILLAENYDLTGLPQNLEEVIKNPIHKGWMRMYHGTPNEQLKKAKHPPIVSESDWETANNRWVAKKTSRVSADELFADVAITGLLRCSCDRKLYAMRKMARIKSGDKLYSYMYCKGENCRASYKTGDLESMFEGIIGRLEFRTERYSEFVRAVREQAKEMSDTESGRLKLAESKGRKLKSRLMKVQEDYLAEKIAAEDFHQMSNKIRKDIAFNSTEIETAKSELGAFDISDSSCLEALAGLNGHYQSGSPELKKAILETFFGDHIPVRNPVLRNSVADYIFVQHAAPVQEVKQPTAPMLTRINRKRENRPAEKVKCVSVWKNPRNINDLPRPKYTQTEEIVENPDSSRLTWIETWDIHQPKHYSIHAQDLISD